jgi:hypothetical protein
MVIRVNSLASAKRLLSRLILQLQKKEVTGPEAKDLCYLLTSYVNIHKTNDLETKLLEIELRINNNDIRK